MVRGSSSSGFDGQYTALILRPETVVNSQASGYVNFFVGDASAIYVGQKSYLIDKSGELSVRLKEAALSQAVLNENDLTLLKNSLYDFNTSFKPSDYYEVYHFKYQIESQILDLVNSRIFKDDNSVFSGSYASFDSELAGIVMHYTDGFESVNLDTFDAASFKKTEYRKDITRGNDYVEIGDPLYKVITSEDWNLVIQINNPKAFADLDVVSIEFLKDNITATADFELVPRGGIYYGVFSLNKYMIRYASERYVQISFKDDTYTGLKVPKTAVTENTYYAVPVQYLTEGNNSSEKGFAVKTKNSDGMDTVNLRYPEIVRQTDELCYIPVTDPNLKEGDVIVQQNSSNQFEVGMTAGIEGVYIYSGGKAIFRFIDILGENNGYYIVAENTEHGIGMYDKVYTNYKEAEK